MIPRDKMDDLLKRAGDVVKAVRFDNSGAIIAGQYMGGNGGLSSPETRDAAERLDAILSNIRQFYPPSDDPHKAMLGKITGIMGDVLAAMEAEGLRGDPADLRLFIDRFCERWG